MNICQVVLLRRTGGKEGARAMELEYRVKREIISKSSLETITGDGQMLAPE